MGLPWLGSGRRERSAPALLLALAALVGPAGSGRRTPRSSEVADRILAAVREKGRVSLSELRDTVDVGWGSLYYALGRLERDAKVSVRSVGRRRIVYLAGARQVDPVILAALSGTSLAVARGVLSRADASVDELSKVLGLTPRVVYYHVHNLARLGLVARNRVGRLQRVSATALLAAALAPEGRPHAAGRSLDVEIRSRSAENG